MNAQQRKALEKHADALRGHLNTINGWEGADPGLEARKALAGQIEDIRSEVESERDAEMDKFDNMSEGLQQGDNGQRIEQAGSSLDDAQASLQEAIDMLEDEHVEADDIDMNEVANSLDQGIDYIDEACNG